MELYIYIHTHTMIKVIRAVLAGRKIEDTARVEEELRMSRIDGYGNGACSCYSNLQRHLRWGHVHVSLNLDIRAAIAVEAPGVLHQVRVAALEGDTTVVNHPWIPNIGAHGLELSAYCEPARCGRKLVH